MRLWKIFHFHRARRPHAHTRCRFAVSLLAVGAMAAATVFAFAPRSKKRAAGVFAFKDQVHCRIDVDGTKIFYHHEIEHLSKPRGSQNIRLVCLPWRLPKMVKCTKPLRGIENSKLRYLKNSSTIG